MVACKSGDVLCALCPGLESAEFQREGKKCKVLQCSVDEVAAGSSSVSVTVTKPSGHNMLYPRLSLNMLESLQSSHLGKIDCTDGYWSSLIPQFFPKIGLIHVKNELKYVEVNDKAV